MFPLKSKKTPTLGVDISSTSVKLLEISRSGKGFCVESHAVEPLPLEAVTEKEIQDVDAVGQTLRKALKRAGSKTKSAAIAVPGSAVITKIISMPAILSEDDMEQQIQLEADQYIPYPLEEINLDFEVIGPTAGDDESLDVLLAASKSENVEMRTAALELAGLTPAAVDVEPYAIEHLCRALPGGLPDEGIDRTVAIMDIGATLTTLNVIHDRTLIYTREQQFGGKELTDEIMRRFDLSYEEAGRGKKFGGLPDNYEADVLEPFKINMAHQVSRFLQFFFSSSDYDGVDQIMLAGGCALIPGIDEFIESHIGTPTVVMNPLAQMSFGPGTNRQRLEADAPSFLIACGLAVRGSL
ncbi:MAG: pilus assembly protein PilM [Halofilum sp. (in: g-proteobacteria)]